MRGVWAIAGTDLGDVYPCMCLGDRPCGMRCPCRGRGDVETMPSFCCGRRAAETKERSK